MPLFDLTGRSVIVTGASKGIGRGIAAVFAAAGANVVVAARSTDDLDRCVADISAQATGKILGIRTDVSDPGSCANLATATLDAFGSIDIVCANAGIFPEAPLATMTTDQLSQVLNVNLKGTVYVVQACLAGLTASGNGRVIITSSITGPITGYPGWSHYGASKAAQLGFMRSAALELAPAHITVNAILPGNIRTEGVAALGDDYISTMTRSIPARALGTPADIGHLAAFLASTEAGYITGQAIAVDGGQVLPESLEAIAP